MAAFPRFVPVQTIKKSSIKLLKSEVKLNNLEFDYLFQGFSINKEIIEKGRALDRADRSIKLFKNKQKFKIITPISYSSTLRIGLTVVDDDPAPWTPKEARQDYTKSYKLYLAQRKEAFELVKGIAQRYPKIVDGRQRKRRTLKSKRVFEVEQFPPQCYYENSVVKDESPNQLINNSIGKIVATSIKQVKKRKRPLMLDYSNLLIGPCLPQTDKPNRVERFHSLISKLSKTELGRCLAIGLLTYKIRRCAESADKLYQFQQVLDSLTNAIEPQMDVEGVGGKPPVESSHKGNVVITEPKVEQGEGIGNQRSFRFHAIPKEIQTYSNMADRWLYYGKFNWTTSHSAGNSIFVFDTYNNIISSQNYSALNSQLFFSHRLFHTNCKFRLVMNSNRYQMGSLIVSFVYFAGRQVTSSGEVINAYRLIGNDVQRNHAFLSAGTNNSVELHVPYHYPDSLMRVTEGDLTMGQLCVRVFNPLVVVDSVSPSISVSLFFCFDNPEMYGTVDRYRNVPAKDSDSDQFEFIQPQMDTIGSLCNVGGEVLTTIGRGLNRDNPPYPLQPMSLVPQAMPSISYMSNIPDPVNVLRADPRAQSISMGSQEETTIPWIIKRKGLLSTITWKMDNPAGSILYAGLASPTLTKSEIRGNSSVSPSYYRANSGNYVYPPVSVISSCFGYFRGSLKLTIQMIATAFHTGSLMFAIYPGGFVPYVSGRDTIYKPTIDVLRSCPHQIIDFGEQTEFCVEIPWYNENAWADNVGLQDSRRTSTLTNFYLVVVNPLIVTDRVPPSAYINLFISAGDDFELAIPRHSILGSIWNTSIKPPSDYYLKCYNKEAKVYTTWERNLLIKDNKYAITSYIQNVSDGWSGYLNCEKGCYYKLNDKTSTKVDILVYYNNKGGTVTRKGKQFSDISAITYGVYDPILSNSNAQGLVFVKSAEKAIKYAKAIANNTMTPEIKLECCCIWESDSDWSMKYNGSKWVQCDNTEGTLLWTKNSYTQAAPQIDNLPITSLETPAMITKMGLLTFGEKTPDIKDLMRRYISLCSISGTACNEKFPRDCCAFAKICVHPFRKLNEHESRTFDNRAREGLVSLLNTAYLGYTGGLRYLFITNTDTGASFPEGTMIYVQHRYDDDIGWDKALVESSSPVRELKDFMLTSYATFSQSLTVNNTFRVEVPWYQKEEFRYCVPCRAKFNNGRLYVWIHCPVDVKVNIEVYYSYSDDTDNICWQGFPELLNLTTITPEPQMETEPAPQGIFSTFKKACQAHEKAGESIVSVTGSVADAVQQISASAKKLENVADMIIPPEISNETLQETAKTCKDKSSEGLWFLLKKVFSTVSDKMFSLFTHIIYAILSPTVKTVAWAVVNLFHQVFGFSWDLLSRLSKSIGNVWQSLVTKFQSFSKKKSPQEQPQEVPEPQMEYNDTISEYSGLLYGCITSFCKIKSSPPSWKGISEGLFGIGQATRSSYNVGNFISDNVRLLKRVFHRFLDNFGLRKSDYALLAGIDDNRLKTWMMESFAILASSEREHVFDDPDWTTKAFELAVVGRGFLISISNSKIKVNFNLDRQIRELVKGLTDLEQQLINRKCLTPVRYEPWCCWIGGSAGCGKSNLAQYLSDEVAKDLGLRTSCYSMTFGQDYFDGFNHSSIFIDDFKTVSISTAPQLYVQYLQMKSAVPFNPPFARVEDKDRFINFQNLFITANSMFFENEPGIHDFDAYNRRRDFLIEMVPKDVDKICNPRKHYTMEQLSNLEQSRAYLHTNNRAINGSSKMEIVPRPGETLKAAIIRLAIESSRNYHNQESRVYADRCQKHRELLNNATGSTLDDYLNNVKDQFSKFEVDLAKKSGVTPVDSSVIFKDWIGNAKVSSSFLEPQMDTDPQPSTSRQKFRWPNILYEDGDLNKSMLSSESIDGISDMAEYAKTFVEGEVMEPYIRCVPYKGEPIDCCHEIMDTRTMEYNTVDGVMYSSMVYGNKLNCRTLSTPFTQCYIMKNGKPALNPKCILLKPETRNLWLRKVTDTLVKMTDTDWLVLKKWILLSKDPLKQKDLIERFPPEIIEAMTTLINPDIKEPEPMKESWWKKFAFWQKEVKDSHELVGGHAIPVEPRWKRFSKALWSGLCTIFKWIMKVINVLLVVMGILSALFSFLTIGYIMYTIPDSCHQAAPSPLAERRLVEQGYVLKDVADADWSTRVLNPRAYNDPTKIWVPTQPQYETQAVVKPQLHPSGDYKTIKSSSNMRAKAMKLLGSGNNNDPEIIRLCSSTSNNTSFSNIIKKCSSNVFFLIGEKDHVQYKSRCIGLYNKKFLVIKHYIEFFESKDITTVRVVSSKGTTCITYTLSELNFHWTEEGYGIGELPASYPFQFANIVKYIPTERFDGHYPREGIIMEGFQDAAIEHHLDLTQFNTPLTVPSKKGMNAWNISRGFQYNWGGSGKCGSLIFCPSMNSPLVGIHTAGVGEKIGYGEILIRETFIDETETITEFVTPQMEYKENTYVLPGEYGIVGTLDYNMMVHSPKDTKIIPSEIHGVFPKTTEPAPLSSEDPRLAVKGDPFLAGMSKRCMKVKEFDRQNLDDAAADLCQKLVVQCKPVKTIAVLTTKEAVEGLTVQGYEPMEMTTSEGYPWVKMRPSNATNKSWLFKFSEYPDGRRKLEKIHKDLSSVLDLKQKMRSQCVVPSSYFSGCLKDSRILLEKTKAFDKTRIFEISPVDLTIAQRQYFLDFDVAYQTARFSCENTIGINPEGEEWSYLANSLLAFSPYILTADYSGYGPRLNQTALQKCFDISNVWYDFLSKEDQETKDKNWNIRECIKMEVSQGLHIAKNLVFRPVAGLPSGNAETVIRNSMVNSLYIRVAYLGLAEENASCFADLYWFKQFVLLYHNGDDLIMAVKPEIIGWFNNRTLIEWFARYDIKMTDALKSGKVREYCSLQEATYLKRGFMPHPTRPKQWMAPLEEASITDTANWIWRCLDQRAASLVNSEMCARLAYSRGRQFYDQVVKKLTAAWLIKGVEFKAPSWKSLDDHVWEGTEGPHFSF
ncbi:polyprotein [Dinocampus coccinellae paralysis virus]|uniref:Genome polyprotein n=1 Tax=Dinocampus coccinellae paralysis virus TaxID=1541119 RepID=A0A0A0QIW4_9VIRU|nr:polyprotein [Dinocampus coccinellae paralysis virus]AIM39350.1 polyprotein [Dinocampus coccinellae paralysis virus]